MMLSFTVSLCLAAAAAFVARLLMSTAPSNIPQVTLDRATFTGMRNNGIDKSLGIPYAQPPTGDLRFRLPVAIESYTGIHNASAFGPACLQKPVSFILPDNLAPEARALLENMAGAVTFLDTSEDCLTVNIWKPAHVPRDVKLPVVVWIYGGGFEMGGSASYDGSVIVQRSVDIGEPIIYVSMNYRVSVFGFPAGSEVKAAGIGNLGLQDQRQALRWVRQYISTFNGDPSKVTLWGQSAGAISAALHMLANGGDTEGLFRGVFMQSGSIIPYGDIVHGQKYHDDLVNRTGCQDSADPLQCLREAPSETILPDREGVDSTWIPRTDGTFLRDVPFQAMLKGAVANVPFVTGQCDDEGTFSVLAQTHITTDDAVRTFITSTYLPNATDSEMEHLLELYPQDVAQGSPFDTGDRNVLSPQSKRLAALQGDILITGPRRYFLQHLSDKQPSWSFTSKRMKAFPDLGSFHGHEMANVYGPGDLTDYLVHFVNYLNPNGINGTEWPLYTLSKPALMTFLDGTTPRELGTDDFREGPLGYLNSLLVKYPL